MAEIRSARVEAIGADLVTVGIEQIGAIGVGDRMPLSRPPGIGSARRQSGRVKLVDRKSAGRLETQRRAI